MEALRLWRGDLETNAQVEQWLESMQQMSERKRRAVRTLTYAYYRLARALQTGRTVRLGNRSDRDYTTLGDLRREFRRNLNRATRGTRHPTIEYTPGGEVDTDLIEVEELDIDESEVDERDEGAERGALLLTLSEHRKRKEKALDEREERLEEAKSAAIAGAVAEKAALGGGRTTLHDVAKEDGRVIGYVRVSGTGNPCAFCSMLISRGLLLYSSRAAASQSSQPGREGESYHTNCHCYPEPVYSKAQYRADPRFAQNRELSDLWQEHIAGKYSGQEALNAWRRFLNHRRGITATQRKAV